MSRREQRLHAFHDGELSGRVAGRVERQVADSPELAAELRSLRLVGEAVRRREASRAAEEPDLWDRIALRLPAADAERAEAAAEARGSIWGWPALRPLGAGALAMALVAAVTLSLWRSGPDLDVVNWMEAQTPVMVLQGDEDTTIIWMMEPVSDDRSEGSRDGWA